VTAIPHTVVEWRLRSGLILTSIVGRPDDAPEMKPRAQRAVCRPFVPYGTEAWRLAGESDWRGLDALPPEWGLRRLTPEDVRALPEGDPDEDEELPRGQRGLW
jgi:hypothetical protein